MRREGPPQHPEEAKISRRESLKKMAAGISLAFLAGEIPHQPKEELEPIPNIPPEIKAKIYPKETIVDLTEMSAEQVLERFPTEIPDAAKVEKFPVPGAKFCLVHVRERHTLSKKLEQYFEEKTGTKDDYQDVWAVQDDIYKIITHLLNYYGIKEVYSEAVTPATENAYKQLGKIGQEIRTKHKHWLEEIQAIQKELQDRENLEKKYPDPLKRKKYEAMEKNYIRKLLEILSNSWREKEQKQNTEKAITRLPYDTGVTILGAETSMMNEITDKIGTEEITQGRRGSPRYNAVTFGLREDVLLQRIWERKLPLGIAIYGAAHSWEDNIRGWNTKYPEAKFCLIEITPENLAKEKANKDKK